jgi:predicted  nucleic acid-binding Zn-ribbon protein
MKLDYDDIDRLTKLAKENVTIKGALDKLFHAWMLVDTEYFSIKAELDANEVKTKKIQEELSAIYRHNTQLNERLESFYDRNNDDEDEVMYVDEEDIDDWGL